MTELFSLNVSFYMTQKLNCFPNLELLHDLGDSRFIFMTFNKHFKNLPCCGFSCKILYFE